MSVNTDSVSRGCASATPRPAHRELNSVLPLPSAAAFSSVPCTDLRAAVVHLGHDAVKPMTLLFVVAQVYNVGKRTKVQQHLRRIRRHSTLAAAL